MRTQMDAQITKSKKGVLYCAKKMLNAVEIDNFILECTV